MLPMPPRTMTARPFSSTWSRPMYGLTSEIARPKSRPARPPSIEDTNSVEAKIRSTLIPSGVAAAERAQRDELDQQAQHAAHEDGDDGGRQERDPVERDQ